MHKRSRQGTGLSGAAHAPSAGSRPRQRPDARAVAFEVLQAVETQDSYANLLLPVRIERAGLDSREAALCTELVYGTLRHQLFYDWVMEECTGRNAADLDPEVRICVRLGLHQLINLSVAQYAVVSEAVNLAHRVAAKGANFVNAALRQYLRIGEEEIDRRLRNLPSRLARLAVRYSHPEWVVSAFKLALDKNEEAGAQIPATWQNVEDALAADNEKAYVNLCARPGLISVEELADEVESVLGAEVAPSELSPYGLIISSGNPGRLPSVRNHAAAVEDQGSQLVAALAANVPVQGEDRRWLDMCAGPGGKAALLGALSAQRGGELVANEVVKHRAELVSQACAKLPNVTVTCEDGLLLADEKGFDRVLVDAPCTGLGTLRRHPESRYRARLATLPQLTRVQRGLVENALRLVRVGGVVVYSTCSPHPAETISVMRAVLKHNDKCELVPVGPTLKQLVDAEAWPEGLGVGEEFMQLWPHIHLADGMFAAVLRRIK